jgi:hypothetical protein
MAKKQKKKRPEDSPAMEKGRRALLKFIKDRRQFKNRRATDRARRLVIFESNHRKLVSGSTSKRQFDLAAFDREVQRDWESLLKDGARQQKEASRLFRQQRTRQREALRTINKHRGRFEYKKGNPHAATCIWRARPFPDVLINEQTFSDGVFNVTSPTTLANVGNNVIRFNASAQGRGAYIANPFEPVPSLEPFSNLQPVESLELITEHVFVTTASQAGSLSVTATYAPIGTIFLGAPGALVAAGSAGAEIDLYIRVLITPHGRGQSRQFEVPLDNVKKIVDENVQAGYRGESQLVVVGSAHSPAEQFSQNNVVQVDAGDTITVIAGFDIILAGELRGIAQATFSPAPSGLNVPMVLVTIDG